VKKMPNDLNVVMQDHGITSSHPLPIATVGLTVAPVNNSLVVTTAQVELKAGTAALSGRKQMIVYPPSAGTIYWGATGITTSTGAPLASTSQPLIIDFDPTIYVPLYAVSDGTDRTVQVVELK
jgi:hypothetical protein